MVVELLGAQEKVESAVGVSHALQLLHMVDQWQPSSPVFGWGGPWV